MKKICIVSFCNIYLLPYARTYIDAITESGIECTLLFWDRDGVGGDNDVYPGCVKTVYSKRLGVDSSSITKFSEYVGATCFIRNTLQKQHFDGIVFLQTQVAVACENIICKKYRGKYIIDIRDFSFENISMYRRYESKVIRSSYRTVISSQAYAKFLDNCDFIIAHNYSPFPTEVVEKLRMKSEQKASEPIEISFIGTVRFFEMDKKVLNLFANDSRFKMNFYGTGSEVLKEYCLQNGIKNTDFYGVFKPEQITDFYMQTSLINNLYGNHNKYLDFALSNKLYHAAQFYIPILVCPDTYMEEVSTKYKFGFVVDVNDAIMPDKLYEWYKSFDRSEMRRGCDEFLYNVKKENTEFNNMICSFLRYI